MRLLYLCDADSGGIAEYAIRQFHALSNAGVEVTFLCRPTFEVGRLQRLGVLPRLPAAPASQASMVLRILSRISDARAVAATAVEEATRGDFDGLLLACYAEYFAPFWAPILRRASRQGLVIGTIAHDPVRDFMLGPQWWHQWSVRQAYSFVSHVFVHDDTPVDFGGPKPEHIQVHQISHGPYEVSPQDQDRSAIRARYGFSDTDTVFLSFGQIRDGKNLDRFLRVMPGLPGTVKLLVAGTGGSASQRPPEAYVQMAKDLGVVDRCAWDLRYIPEGETGNVFAVADFILLTYSAKFRSASGVLNTAVRCSRPVLASSGPGPLKTVVEKYNLGVFVAPDDESVLLAGAKRLLTAPPDPEWTKYQVENSWELNVRSILNALSR